MKQTIVTLVDDLTGKPANQTIEFGIDGTTYTIDLTDKNAAKMRADLHQFTAAGRRVQAPKKPAGPTATPAGRAAVRAWARDNGWPEMAYRGRIPDDVVEQYIAARRGYPTR